MSKKERYGIIYKIENTVNGKCYIGQTTKKNGFNGRYSSSGEGIERVYKYHKSLKERNIRYNVHLLGAIEKYGFEVFDVIEEFDVAYSKEELDDLERKYIKEFDCIENGYNNKEGGSDGKYSEEACKKISVAKKGKCCGENNPFYGNHKFAGENNPMYGKQHSEESRRKMSESLRGKFAGENNPKARKVICLNDSKIFNTLKECTEYYKINKRTVRLICQGETKKSRTGLVFMYYDEYIQQEQTS